MGNKIISNLNNYKNYNSNNNNNFKIKIKITPPKSHKSNYYLKSNKEMFKTNNHYKNQIRNSKNNNNKNSNSNNNNNNNQPSLATIAISK